MDIQTGGFAVEKINSYQNLIGHQPFGEHSTRIVRALQSDCFHGIDVVQANVIISSNEFDLDHLKTEIK